MENLLVVVGLGNPGREYEGSRHNLGFTVLDRLAERYHLAAWRRQFDGLVTRGDRDGRPFLLVKPQTFMNVSGRSVGALQRFYKLPPANLLVVVDDMDLAVGKVRLRIGGSDGGHKGLRSVIEGVGSRDFKRIRIGIGRPRPGQSVLGHVLGRGADPEEGERIRRAVDIAVERVAEFIEHGTFENWSAG